MIFFPSYGRYLIRLKMKLPASDAAGQARGTGCIKNTAGCRLRITQNLTRRRVTRTIY